MCIEILIILSRKASTVRELQINPIKSLKKYHIKFVSVIWRDFMKKVSIK